MFITGHVAAAVLAARHWELDARLVVAATLFPDAVDKTARYILNVVPSGRLPTHTLLALALTSTFVCLLGWSVGRAGSWAKAWVTGFGLHFACDFAAPVPLLWPFVNYDLKTYSLAHVLWHPLSPIEQVSLIFEGTLVILALCGEWRRCRQDKPSIVPRC
jgi:hypothetical protein